MKNRTPAMMLVTTCLLTACLSAEVFAVDEQDFLGQETARSERTIGSKQNALWILPFETTQYLPANPTSAMRNAMAAQQSGRYLEAITILEEATDDSALPDMQLLRASVYMQGDQVRHAQDILSAVLQKSPGLAEAHALMAMAYIQRGKPDAAWLAVQQAQSSGNKPDNQLVTRIASYVLQAQGKLEQASELMAALNAKSPADALSFAREAELALSLGDESRATARIATARGLTAQPSSTNPLAAQSPYVMAVSGLTWLIEDKPVQAQAAFERALQQDPEDAKALLGLGLAEARQGKLDASLKQLRKAAQADPGSAMIQTYLGRTLQQNGQTDEAQSAYQTAIKLDPQDPAPWTYLAQSQIEQGMLGAAQESLRQAEQRRDARGVYRGQVLLNEDAQTQQANLARLYQRAGLNDLAWQTLNDGSGEKSAVTLKNQAEILRGQRFAETARRSLTLQSLFSDALDALPVTLDVYGDGGGQTGANAPQSGAIGGLSGQTSVGNYGALFNPQSQLEADAIVGNRQTWGEQVRGALGNEQFGFSLAQRHYQTEGFSSFNSLDNTTWQGVLKWNPLADTRLFLSYQDFRSDRSMVLYPTVLQLGTNIDEESWVARLGMSQRLSSGGELRALLSHQETELSINYLTPFTGTNSGVGKADSAELQYRQAGANSTLLGGGQVYRDHTEFLGATDTKIDAGQLYVAQTIQLTAHWDMDWTLGWAWLKNNDLLATFDTELTRWTPRLGLVYSPGPATHLRFALGQHLGLPETGGASLAPVETAGIVNTRPSEIGKLVKSAGIAVDHRLNPAWLASGQVQIRDVREPVSDSVSQYLEKSRYQDGRAGLTWMPVNTVFTTTLDAGYERRINESSGLALDSIADQRLRDVKWLLRWSPITHLSLKGEISRNWVDGDYQFSPLPYRDASTQLNTSLRWQLKQGAIELGVRNLLDDKFEYTESDPLAPRFSAGRFAYGNARLSW